MPSTIAPRDEEISEELILFRRLLALMATHAAHDGLGRQRMNLDAIAAGVTLPAVTTVGTVTTVTTVTGVSTVTNVAGIAGEGVRQFEVPAHNCFANAIRNRLSFS